MLLTRRQLMERVEKSLRPLFRGQMLQVLIGVALIVLGVQCWARNTQIPHRVVNGVILHVYGVIVISQALLVCTRIRRIDYSKSVVDIRSKLDSLRSGYLRAGVIIGFVWWLMWIPVAVALGFDAVLHPQLSDCLVSRRDRRFRCLGLAVLCVSESLATHPLNRGEGNSLVRALPPRISHSTKSKTLKSADASAKEFGVASLLPAPDVSVQYLHF